MVTDRELGEQNEDRSSVLVGPASGGDTLSRSSFSLARIGSDSREKTSTQTPSALH